MKPVLRRPEAAASFYHLWGDDLQHAACLAGGARELEHYRACCGFEALAKALRQTPSALIKLVKVSGLRGAMTIAGYAVGARYGYIYLRKEYLDALGYTIQRPLEDRFLMRRSELENKITVLLGGRAAEDLVFAETSTGASARERNAHRRRPGDARRATGAHRSSFRTDARTRAGWSP